VKGLSSASEEANSADEQQRLMRQITDLAAETHPQRSIEANLDSSLERDFGFDSLAKVELMLRVEREFSISLPERALAESETPRDLLRFLGHTTHSPQQPTGDIRQRPLAGDAVGAPADAQTLLDVLEWHVRMHPERPHIHLYDESDQENSITYSALSRGAEAVGAALAARGLERGETVAIMLPTCRDYFFAFFGVLLAGGVPVPLYPPARMSQIEDHLNRHVRIMANARVRVLITIAEAKPIAMLLRARVESLRSIVTASDLSDGGSAAPRFAANSEDLALLQYTSGSTGDPKGVMLTHANLLANIRAMGVATLATAKDAFVSWLPLYHDMGLIGAWFSSLYFAMPLVVMSPLAFLARPQRWLWAIHRYRGTISGGPNFAYELCVRKIADADIEGLDLSSWRLAFNGAEPVSPDTLAAFAQRFQHYGFDPTALAPVYGLAEVSLALCFPPPGRGPLVDVIERHRFMRDGKASLAQPGDSAPLRFVSCGKPLAGHDIRIVDAAGSEVEERREGHLHFQGPSASNGYFRAPEHTRRLFRGAWRDSGDLAYMAQGEVYITGRAKDIIIRGGRNIYPHELEEAVGNLSGARKGSVAVFAVADPSSATERLVVLAETREQDPTARSELVRRINDCALDLLGMPADDVMLAPPNTVLKTSSGKIRRAASREFYQQGGKARRSAPVWMQFMRLGWQSAIPGAWRVLRFAAERLYGFYLWLLLILFAFPVWGLVSVARRPEFARRVVHAAARALTALGGIGFTVRGLEHFPGRGAFVAAANHSSYLDAFILAAAVPPDLNVSFVAKRDFAGMFVLRWFLTGLGVILVERFDARKGAEDAAQALESLRNGKSLLFFPEGTFVRTSGLLPFRMGAFVVAAQGNVPVLPIAIRGARSLLRADSWLPRRSAVTVTVGPPIEPQGASWKDSLLLRDAVRAAILRASGEPDAAE
jgi:1-acyl-sn-glycerol-3-phosphate acyltransferase